MDHDSSSLAVNNAAPTSSPAPAPSPVASPSGEGAEPSESHPGGPSLWDRAGALFHGLSQEGLGGVVGDPEGALSRLSAEQTLLGKLNVVDDGMVDPHLPNEVSQGQFDRAAHEYSDIGLGRGDLTVTPDAKDPNAAGFKNGTMNDVAALLQTSVGRSEIDTLSNNVSASGEHRKTTIQENAADTKAGYRIKSGSITLPTKDTDAAAVYNPQGEAGAGTDAHVHYNPGKELKHSRSDVVLAHELRHAVDETEGTMQNTVIQPDDSVVEDRPTHDRKGIHEYEHQALGAGKYADEPINENHYRSERVEIGHSGDEPAVIAGDEEMKRSPFYRDR